MLHQTEIERFVRDTLGCGCPAEVFNQIETGAVAPGLECPCTRLAIGGRLLVYLAAPSPDRPLPGQVELLVREGLAERNTSGFNRFRLVCVVPAASQTAALMDAFDRSTGDDDRAHLHVLEHSAIPASLRPG